MALCLDVCLCFRRVFFSFFLEAEGGVVWDSALARRERGLQVP